MAAAFAAEAAARAARSSERVASRTAGCTAGGGGAAGNAVLCARPALVQLATARAPGQLIKVSHEPSAAQDEASQTQRREPPLHGRLCAKSFS